MREAFALQKLLTLFPTKHISKFKILTFEIFFCKMLTNDVVSFEQPGPGVALLSRQCTDRRDIENTMLVSFDIKFIR